MKANRIMLTLALFPFVYSTGCVAPGPPPTTEGAVQQSIALIAGRLVQAAELRTDLSSMRVNVHEIRETEPERVLARNSLRRADELQSLRQQLENEFMLAFSDRLHIIASDLAPAPVAASSGSGEPSLRQVSDSFGATHAIVGEFVQVGEDLQVSIRLVDVKTLLIVAAARGTVPVHDLQSSSYVAQPQPDPSQVATSFDVRPPQGGESHLVSRSVPSVTILPEAKVSSAYTQPDVPLEIRRAQDALAEAQQPLPDRRPVAREPEEATSTEEEPIALGPALLRQGVPAQPIAAAAPPSSGARPPKDLVRPEGPATLRLRASGRPVDG